MPNDVLVVGGGGREHAIAWKLSQSASVKVVYVAPGNGGTQGDGQGKMQNVSLNVDDNAAVVKFCKEKNIEMVCVGPEIPLVNGLADELRKANILCFGPSKLAARLEGSKAFSKDFMARNNIPTAIYKTFTDFEEASKYVNSLGNDDKVVVKASGLAAGKGVILPETKEEALQAVREIMVDKAFGKEAGEEVVIEELLVGPEVSVFAFSDGTNVHLLPPAQDHKRIYDNDRGPNTGGMGAYCPTPALPANLKEYVKKDIVERSVLAAKKEGFPFIGLLYSGLMITKKGPMVLEYNCRFGDPETQAVLMLLGSDLYTIMKACARGNLAEAGEIVCHTEKAAATVVIASKGYPGSYEKNKQITGIEEAEKSCGVKVFHAGTALKDGNLVSSGGRVLAVSASADRLQDALTTAYAGIAKINFEGMQFRKDIGKKGLPSSRLSPTDRVHYLLAGAAAFAVLLKALRSSP